MPLPSHPSHPPLRPFARACAFASLALLAPAVPAQEFALYVSPPRVETEARPGETRRQVIELHHVGRETGRFRIYTNDWSLKDDGTVDFTDALAPQSCRPWVAIERRELAIAPGGRHRYRFEISPPAGTPPRECRFAIMIEGLDTTKVAQGAFSFPVTGRIGVVVYAKVGDVEAKLEVGKASVVQTKSGRLPVLEVANRGGATGRLEGFLVARDGDGKEIELAPDPAPILPGASRAIALVPVNEEGRPPATLRFPLTVKGTLEWGKSRQPLDLRFEP
jgi:hypothetical protein